MGTFKKIEDEMIDAILLMEDRDELSFDVIKEIMEDIVENHGLSPEFYGDYLDELVEASYDMEPVRYG